jgi:hypothetical protein
MKTLLTFALAMSLFLTGLAEPTNELAILSKVSINEQKAKITLIEGIGRVKVFVKDITGKTIYATSYKVSETVVMPFNLEKLPTGKYVIRIEAKDASIDYEIETQPKKAIEVVTPFKANVKALDDRCVKVSLYELLSEGAVTVRVYDPTHRLIYKDKVDGGLFARKYEFKHFTTKGLYLSITDAKGNSKTYNL